MTARARFLRTAPSAGTTCAAKSPQPGPATLCSDKSKQLTGFASFVLSMQGGKKGLLVNSENVCRKPQHATVRLSAQNGKVEDLSPVIANSCGGKGKRHGHR